MPDRAVPRLRFLRGRRGLTISYADAVAALTARGRFGVSLGLERVARLMAELDHPERALHGALVAGTNGKGSACAMAGAILVAAGLRVGSMPKPHLVSYRERIAVDGRPISSRDFAAAVARVLPAVDRVAAEIGPPTEFEALTAAAIVELARRHVDLAIVEVGLGGRLDATNVLDLGVAGVTNVQHDHERHLGRTLAAIGAEKAAIIKRGDLAVTGATGRGLRPIVDRCAALRVPLRRAGRGQPYDARLRHAGWDGIVVDAETPAGMLQDLRIGLLGGHQARNAVVALALVDAITEDAGRRGVQLAVDDEAIRRGLGGARWPGRLELLDAPDVGRVLLDGAHNPAGAAALTGALAELGVRRMPLVFGAMADKRVHAVLRALAPLDPLPVFTRVEAPRALTPERLARIWRRVAPNGAPAESASTPQEALARAAARRSAEEPIVVAGSLYLIGAVRGMITGQSEEG